MKTVPFVALSVVLTLGSGGCSWIFVQPLQPNYERGETPNCTSNVAAPVIDTIFTALDTIELVSVAGASNVQNKDAVLTGATLGIILWGASAIYGYSHTSECSDALAEPAYHPYRRPRPPAAYRPPAAPPPGPAAPPAAAHEQGAPASEPSVTVPSTPGAPQQRDDDGPG